MTMTQKDTNSWKHLMTEQLKFKAVLNRSASDIFDNNIRAMLEDLNIRSYNFTLPPMPRLQSKTGDYFATLTAILYEWKNLDEDDEILP